jgi:hypothetical protein
VGWKEFDRQKGQQRDLYIQAADSRFSGDKKDGSDTLKEFRKL